MSPLSTIERDTALRTLSGWSYDPPRRAFYRRFSFADFGAAFSAMTRIAIHAEKVDHHPEWTNVYDRLEIWLTTHDAGGVTRRDVDLARLIDRIT